MKKLVLLLLLTATTSFASSLTRPMKFVTIKAATFLMGSADSENGRNIDESLFMVTLSKDYQMQTTTVTQAQWAQLMKNNPSHFQTKNDCPKDFKIISGISMCANHPVESVSFADVSEFIQKLNIADKKFSYRLPTEAEWERAARAGTGTSYFFSDDGTDYEKYIVLDADRTAEVASKQPNQFGLYDMLGNVSQWVQDYFDFYPEWDLETSVVDPRGPEKGDYRTVRGGNWYEYRLNFFRSAAREFVEAKEVNDRIGFRLVRTQK